MRLLPVVLTALGLAGCGWVDKPVSPWSQSGELVVVTRNMPTTLYENAEGSFVGPEHDLANLFAKELGVRAKFVIVQGTQEVLAMLESGKVHMAAAGLTSTPELEKRILFGPAFQTVQTQVIYRAGMSKPASIKDLVGKRIEVPAGGLHAEQMAEARKMHPELRWKEVEAKDADELLDRVAEGVIDATVSHSNLAAVAQNFHPELEIGFNLGKPQKLAWAFPIKGDMVLVKKAEAFFARLEKEGTLKRIMDRYYGHVERLERADVVGFLAKMNTLLPNYRTYFHQAQDFTGIDWRMLAALAYQESHWDPLATSPTLVRGMMMLTEDTADRLGVKNRLDARESILAGSRYLLNLKEMLPERVAEPDRTWIALAAYNTGYGHVEDARVLAQRQKLNPDAWVDLKKVLPMLTKPSVYATVKHGFARGGEAVIMVENIRTYYDVLVRYQPPYRPVIPVLGQ